MSPYKYQHVVTRRLLDRWVNRPGTGRIQPFDVAQGIELREIPTRRAAVVEDFVRFLPVETERRWAQLEQHLPTVFSALDDGRLLEDPDLMEVARDCIALHYARSKTVRIVHALAQHRAVESQAQALRANPSALDRHYFDRTGFHPPLNSGAHREWIIGELLSGFAALVESGETFQESVIRNYEEVKDWLSSSTLEIAQPAEGAGEFLIADSPAAALKPGWAGVGPLGGVTLAEATTIILPLGPRHMAAVARVSQVHQLDQAATDLLNSAEVAHAVQGVYYRPGSGLGSFVAGVCKRTIPERG